LGPDVGEEDGHAIRPGPERFGRQVDVDPAGEREGHDERGRGEVARPGERMDPAFEVAVAGQDGGDDQVVGLDRPGDRVVEGSGVADAGRAAVAGQGEPERLERGHQPGRLEIAGDGPGARRQRRLDRRADGQATGDGVAGEQAGADHDRRVGRVGARRDRGDGDRPRPDRDRLAADLDLDRSIGPSVCDRRVGQDRLGRRADLGGGLIGHERRGVGGRE
jgi:hypothetical protein